ncbi:hypothetical protein LTR36_006076 [Oleoguttula mirabilis]|uniref:Tyrosine specific protein phosphatases domain-containing protein n=1 Tax=Oleoguttula mirabilis TaxID=1507867 RepID=A0AAV9JD34_9PEZI|nr:hypothetical protein LTR36_006076 [Oleoguttula mirabilis]
MDQIALTRMRERFQVFTQALVASTWYTKSLLSAGLGLVLLSAWRTVPLPKLLRPAQQRETSEPGLFMKHSSFESFTTASGYTYPKIRVFYHAHPQAGKLPKNLPLLVFMHGLGGNATQFSPLLTSMVNVAPCLAIDLPGCGLSDFTPKDPGAYSTAAFAELLSAAIDRFRDRENNQQVVLIGHSMGCSITALLASSASPLQADYIIGMIAICPRANAPSPKEIAAVDRLRWVPAPLFDVMRFFDRRGGLSSPSVTRVVGHGADVETRRLQQNFNKQSKSAVVLRFVTAALPARNASAEKTAVPWPGKEVWSGVKIPLFLVAGEADRVTPSEEIEQISQWLSGRSDGTDNFVPAESVAATEAERRSKAVMDDVAPEDSGRGEPAQESNEVADAVPITAGDVQLAQYRFSNHTEDADTASPKQYDGSAEMVKDEHKSTKHNFVLKTTILPAPAAHGLMYATSTVRILSGLIEGFLSKHVDEHLGLGWQLQHLTTSGKWDVKNLKKWQSVDPCSAPIADIFRAMKTMREVDDIHNPKEFVKHFSSSVIPDGVAMVVDISHESPVYNPKGLEEGGVEYHKFPTVSKLPPTADEVEHFISLIDQLRRSPRLQNNSSRSLESGQMVHPTIGVHCHYGFNRTGFFIVCYLVERLGYKLQDAIDEFAEKRAPGIKHEHFKNELYVRYAVKLERRGTIVGWPS